MRVYLDSCIVIYLLEGPVAVRNSIRQAIREIDDIELCTSGIVLLECLVGPTRRGHTHLADQFRSFLDASEFMEVTRESCERAVAIRAECSLPLPDSLHIAIAERGNCDSFWSADRHFHSKALDAKLQIRLFHFEEE